MGNLSNCPVCGRENCISEACGAYPPQELHYMMGDNKVPQLGDKELGRFFSDEELRKMTTVYQTKHTDAYKEAVTAVKARFERILHTKLVDGVYYFLCSINRDTNAIAFLDSKGNVSAHFGSLYNMGRKWRAI